MKKQIDSVKDFHKKYNIGYSNEPVANLGENKNKLRFKLMSEENDEYLVAANNNDLIEVADALGDMLYILCGTILEHGMHDLIEPIFDEIQKSNMSKLGSDGKPILRNDGKILKGPSYFKPNFSKFFSFILNFQSSNSEDISYCISVSLFFNNSDQGLSNSGKLKSSFL